MTPSEIEQRLAALSTQAEEWGIKIGEPVRVRYSGELMPVWELFEAISSAGGSFCKYVEIFNGSATHSIQFEGELVFPNVAESILRDVETVKEALAKKSSLVSKDGGELGDIF